MKEDIAAILDFWVDEVGPEGWYNATDDLDATIRRRFEPLWEAAAQGGLREWRATPEGALAYIILVDQFPRNMYRGTAQAFATDRFGVAAAVHGLAMGHDLKTTGLKRQFFYLPLMHSESIANQERCIRLMLERMPDAAENLRHACAHRDVIRRFGRFPYRSDALGRTVTPPEARYLQDGGYMLSLETVSN